MVISTKAMDASNIILMIKIEVMVFFMLVMLMKMMRDFFFLKYCRSSLNKKLIFMNAQFRSKNYTKK